MNSEYLFIFDYSSGTIYRHKLTDEELEINSSEVFEKICDENNLYEEDCYYMFTSESDVCDI